MDSLVSVKGNHIFTDTLIVAEGIQRKHDSITKVLKRYKSDFKDLGKAGLAVRPSKSGQKQHIYELNETQAVFLLTLMDNSVMVIRFKKELSKQFVAMRNMLLERQSSEWLQTRKHGKLIRRQETDIISELILYSKKQGSKHADQMYVTYSKLVNNLVGIQRGQREYATEKVLTVISLIEDLILHTIREDMKKCVYYKEIYKHCKEKANEMMKYVFLPAEKLLTA